MKFIHKGPIYERSALVLGVGYTAGWNIHILSDTIEIERASRKGKTTEDG